MTTNNLPLGHEFTGVTPGFCMAELPETGDTCLRPEEDHQPAAPAPAPWDAVRDALAGFNAIREYRDAYLEENTEEDGDWDVRTAEGLADYDTELADAGRDLADAVTAALAADQSDRCDCEHSVECPRAHEHCGPNGEDCPSPHYHQQLEEN
jgi:hypothetical protein